MNKKQLKQKGLSLVELLVALGLSAVLATALYRVVLANQQGMAITESYAKLQDASRTAFDLMQYDLRMAGYRGCLSELGNINDRLNANSAGYNAQWHDFTGSTNDSAFVEELSNYTSPDSVEAVTGSDVLVLRNAIATDLLVREAQSATDFVSVAGPEQQFKNLKAGDVMMVSDCKNADIFAVSGLLDQVPPQIEHTTAVANGPGNAQKLSQDYVAGSQLLLMHTVTYFVAPSSLIPNVNALYVVDSLDFSSAGSKELVPYVENMQVSYLVQVVAGSDVTLEYRDTPNNSVAAIRVTLSLADERRCASATANKNCIQPIPYERVFYLRNMREPI